MSSLSQNIATYSKPSVLLVDDEVFNLEILEEILEDQGYDTDIAENGREACDKLIADPEKFQTVLLDRMMPVMGGMEVANYMREHDQLSMIPVIMQTARATRQDIEEALNAGILYYLTKPFARQDLVAIVDTALRHYNACQDLHRQIKSVTPELHSQGCIELKTIQEAMHHASRLAQLTDAPLKVVVGLYELLLNAIEHGNLGLGYESKTRLLKDGQWETEIESRQLLPDNSDKTVTVNYEVKDAEVKFTIKDQGSGFNFREFLNINSQRSMGINGRGMLVAKILSFDSLSFKPPGNEVVAVARSKAS